MIEACKVCGGKGFTIQIVKGKPKRTPCDCRNVKDFKTKIEPNKINEIELEEKIPNPYFRDVEFDEEELRETMSMPEHLRDIQVDSYIVFLKSYLQALRLGKKPEKSYIVTAPSGSGKKIFVYSAIKEAMRGGLKTSGLLDTHEIYELMEDKKFGKIKELIWVDVVFMTMGGSPSQPDVIALRHMIDTCERYGIPMVLISRFSGQFLAKYDAMMKTDVGVFTTRRGDYGRLEGIGFSEESKTEFYRYLKKEGNGSEFAGQESASDYKERIRKGKD